MKTISKLTWQFLATELFVLLSKEGRVKNVSVSEEIDEEARVTFTLKWEEK